VSETIDLAKLPKSVTLMLEKASPEIKQYLLQALEKRGVAWVVANLGLLQSQAEYIDSL